VQPRLRVKLDYVSGDANPNDSTLKTFNLLYPKLTYFAENRLFVPANLYNYFPASEWKLREDLRLRTGCDWLWQDSKPDTFYLYPLIPLTGSQRTGSHYFGCEAIVDMERKATRHVQVNVSLGYFFAGASVRAANGKADVFIACWTSYRV
jgi:hypothetical protein